MAYISYSGDEASKQHLPSSHPTADIPDGDQTISANSRSPSNSEHASFVTAAQPRLGYPDDTDYESEEIDIPIIEGYDESESDLSDLSETPEAPETLHGLLNRQAREFDGPTVCECKSWCTCTPKYDSYSPRYLSNPTLDAHIDDAPLSAVRATLDAPGAAKDMDAAEQMRRTYMYEQIFAALRRVQAASNSEHKEKAFETAQMLARQILHASPRPTTEQSHAAKSALRILELLRSHGEGTVKDEAETKVEGEIKDEGDVRDESDLKDEGEVKDEGGIKTEGEFKDEGDINNDGKITNGGRLRKTVWDFIVTAVAGHPDLVMQLKELLPTDALYDLGVRDITDGDLRMEMMERLLFETEASEE